MFGVGVIGGSIWLFVVLKLIEGALFLTMTIFWFRSMQRAMESCHPVSRGADPDSVWLCFIPIFGFFWQFICFTKVSESLAREYHRRGWYSDEDRPGKELGVVAGVIICIVVVVKAIFPIHPGLAFICTLAMCFSMYRHMDRLNSFRERLEKEADPTIAFGQIPVWPNTTIPVWPQAQFVPSPNQGIYTGQVLPTYSNDIPPPQTNFVPQENNSNDLERWAPKNKDQL